MPLESAERELLDTLDRVDQEVRHWQDLGDWKGKTKRWAALRAGEPTTAAASGALFGANLAGNLFERKIAALTESQPDMLVSSRNPQYADVAQVLAQTTRAVLAQNSFDGRVETAADFAGTFGHCGWVTAWDPSADFGQGDIVLRPLDPRRLAVDHRVKDPADLDTQAQYIRLTIPMPLDGPRGIKAIWPARGPLVQPDPDLSEYEAHRPGGFLNRMAQAVRVPIRPRMAVEAPFPWGKVEQYWVVSPQKDDTTGQWVFPAGRVIHRAGDVILDDQANPNWDGRWPLDLWDWRVNFDSHQGRSDMADVQKLQQAFTRVNDATLRAILVQCVATVIGDVNALSPDGWEAFVTASKEGNVRLVKKNPGRQFEFLPPGAVPPQYLQFSQGLAGMMETLLGIPEATQGKRQPGVIASSAVEGLMTAAQTLIRAAARRLEYVVERIGAKLVSRILQYYTADRVVLFNGPGRQWQEYTFRRAALRMEGMEPDAQRQFFANFPLRVQPLSSVAQNKIQRGLLAMQLANSGFITGRAVVAAVEWPNGEAEYEKAQAERQAAQQSAIQEAMKWQLMGLDPSKVLDPGTGGGNGKVRASRDGKNLKMG